MEIWFWCAIVSLPASCREGSPFSASFWTRFFLLLFFLASTVWQIENYLQNFILKDSFPSYKVANVGSFCYSLGVVFQSYSSSLDYTLLICFRLWNKNMSNGKLSFCLARYNELTLTFKAKHRCSVFRGEFPEWRDVCFFPDSWWAVTELLARDRALDTLLAFLQKQNESYLVDSLCLPSLFLLQDDV